MKRLQRSLACMRMLCDTPDILDDECRVSPKLDELGRLLPELLEDPDSKILCFSEWTRMPELVAELVDRRGPGFAVHTGEAPQNQRRERINQFKRDPDCRLLLCSDAGATGLNLQEANIVINLDLP
jgi:SNF2 family DNA or RNA helicase